MIKKISEVRSARMDGKKLDIGSWATFGVTENG
jgi:hypothetical protein